MTTEHFLSFTILHRIAFILFFVSINLCSSLVHDRFLYQKVTLFWIIFIVIYLTSQLILRFISKIKRKNTLESKPIHVCQAFVISSNQCGSFRPITTLTRSDSLFSNLNYTLSTEKISYGTINQPSQRQQLCQTSLLEHYLKTYNPLQIDIPSTVKMNSIERLSTEQDSQIIDNCYLLNCTNKQNSYRKLHEQDNPSSSSSSSVQQINRVIDEQVSECSTKLTTSTGVPILMITDCSNRQRLHTDIIEMNEDE